MANKKQTCLTIQIDRDSLFKIINQEMIDNNNEYNYDMFIDAYNHNIRHHNNGSFEIIGDLFDTVFERVKDGYDYEDEDCRITHYPLDEDYDGFDAYYDVDDEEVIDIFFTFPYNETK